MLEKISDISGLGRRRAADADSLVHFFERERGVIVEFVVSGHVWAATPEVEVRLIPYFKVPGCDFVDAVAVDEVLGEGCDHCVPKSVVLGRRYDWFVEERLCLIRIGGHLARHEA